MSVVYFAKLKDLSVVKIGHSSWHNDRLHAISLHLPYDLDPIAEFSGAWFRERFVQCWFRADNTRGEWFRETPDMWRLMLEARSAGDISIVPPETPHSYVADTAKVLDLLSRYQISKEQVAKAGKIAASSLIAFDRPCIDSRLLLAAITTLLVKSSWSFTTWSELSFAGDERASLWRYGEPKQKRVPINEAAA